MVIPIVFWHDDHQTIVIPIVCLHDDHQTTVIPIVFWLDDHQTIVIPVVFWHDHHQTLVIPGNFYPSKLGNHLQRLAQRLWEGKTLGVDLGGALGYAGTLGTDLGDRPWGQTLGTDLRGPLNIRNSNYFCDRHVKRQLEFLGFGDHLITNNRSSYDLVWTVALRFLDFLRLFSRRFSVISAILAEILTPGPIYPWLDQSKTSESESDFWNLILTRVTYHYVNSIVTAIIIVTSWRQLVRVSHFFRTWFSLVCPWTSEAQFT